MTIEHIYFKKIIDGNMAFELDEIKMRKDRLSVKSKAYKTSCTHLI
mgnify:CR=1 FL=1